LTLRELVTGSDGAVQALISNSESRWVEVFGARRLVTFWKTEQVVGLTGAWPSLKLATLGGVSGDVAQWVPHEAQLSVGQRYLLFVSRGPLERCWVSGMVQGAYPLARKRVTKKRPAADGAASESTAWTVSVSPEQRPFVGVLGSAVADLHGLSLGEARTKITALWTS
jgi:hypothetical protein